MNRRGRILHSSLPSDQGRAAPEARRDDQMSFQPAGDENSRPTARPTVSGRGRLIMNQISSTQQRDIQPLTQPEILTEHFKSVQPKSLSRSNSESRKTGSLSRQGSDLSKSSELSQQFLPVRENNFRAENLKVVSNSGHACQLGLNYVTFMQEPGQSIEEYHIKFDPDIESFKLRNAILRAEKAQNIIGSVYHWTGTNLYLPRRLSQSITNFTCEHPVTKNSLNVTVTFVKTPPDSELLSMYNSLMHKVMTRLDYVLINRQHYSPLHKIPVQQHKLEVWPGWVTSIQRLDGGLKLTVDSSFRVLRLETVRDIMIEIKNQNRPNLKEALEQELVGTIVMTRYNNKPYRIDGIDITKKPSDTFVMSRHDNRQITYIDYMREHWDVQITDPAQPMIIHRPKPKRGQEHEDLVVYLIPELCVTTGLTDSMRSNFHLMKAIAEHTRLPPDIRESKLSEFLNQVSTDERATSILASWGLSVNSTLDVVQGRRLDTETIVFGDNRSFKVPDNADWTRPATSGGLFKTVDIENWVIMYTERDARAVENFLNIFRDVSRCLGVKFCPPRVVKLQTDSATAFVSASKRECRLTDQMVVIITPGKGQREDRYSACKRLFSCELSIPCQFIRCGTISDERKIRSVCQKILIQVVSKVGGQPWVIRFPMRNFMVIGMDAFHNTIDRRNSCVGFVASMNDTASTYWSRVFFQNSLEEIGQKLNSTMTLALARYHKLNGFIPQRIIIYRDGVGDGQMEAVLQIEIAQIMNAIKFYLRDKTDQELPQLSFIIVQKRINTKMSLRDRGRPTNPLPGTFLDHTITHPEYNDFFLVSQHVNQGTVSPTKFVVLSETGTLKLEHHQKLAYKMTHMYYNWCGTIRVPAPCQYAHKLAYLCGQNIKASVNEKIEDKLYYL